MMETGKYRSKSTKLQGYDWNKSRIVMYSMKIVNNNILWWKFAKKGRV